MSTIDPNQIIKKTVLFVRDFLRDNITDPAASSRPSGSYFVLTQRASKTVYYPVILVYHIDSPGIPLCSYSSMFEHTIRIAVDVYATKLEQVDTITDEILAKIKEKRSQFTDYGLLDGRIPVVRHNPPPGSETLHRKTIELEFRVYT